MDKIPVEKNKEYVVDIIDHGYEGEGVAKIEQYTIFIPGAIKGEKVKILIIKVNTSHAFGKVVEILEKSDSRQEGDCNSYTRCGGCNLRHMKYEDTLKLKTNIVQNLVNKTLEDKIEVQETIGMEEPFHYRNKVQYPVGYNKDNEIVTGVYAKRSHQIVETNNCGIQQPISEKIAKFVVDFMKENYIEPYNEEKGSGVIRHIVVRVGIHTKQVMCIIVTNKKTFAKEKELVKELIQNFKEIKTIVKNINMKNTNVIMGLENHNLYGDGYIEDTLGEYTFKISPLSFYQINPIQTEKLYNLAIQKANLNKDDIALDLYCGIGTIGIFASKYVKKVYGIEIVEQAIKDAKENASINNVDNIEFYCGDVEKVLKNIIQKEDITPNVIFIDPPRKGLDKTTIESILDIKPERVIYISCNPATLVRDLKHLSEEYKIKNIQPVDMFPYTSHAELVCRLDLK